MIYTAFDEALYAIKCPTNSRRVLYLFDTNWNATQIPFINMIELIKLSDYFLCKDENIQEIAFKHFGIKPTILEFDLEKINDYCRRT